MKNWSLLFSLPIFVSTSLGFAKENLELSSQTEASSHQGGGGHGSSPHQHGSGGSPHGHGGHGSSHQHGHGSHGDRGHGNHRGHGHHEQRSRDHREARGHYHHGRFDDHYYHSHFGWRHPIVWGGPGFWYGAAWVSPFWFGGVYWGFGPGVVFLPEWQISGWYIGIVSSGYVLLNPAFPSVQVPVVVNINMGPSEDQDEEDDDSD